MIRSALGLQLLLALLWLPRPGSARAAEFSGLGDRAVEIHARVLEYERAREIYVGDGQVRIVQAGGRRLEADWVVVSGRTRRGVASGHVVLVDGDQVLNAEFVQFDLDTLQGRVFEGKFDSAPFRIWGREIEKTGDRTYVVEHGGFTTCKCPDDERIPWSVRARTADLTVGGYGTVRNASIDILEIPVIWMPWMIYPIKTERESGLLFPEFGLGGRNGFEVGVPIFWAAGDPVNVTLTPRYLSQRGFKPDLDVQAVYGEKSGTSLFLSFLHDTQVAERARNSNRREALRALRSQQGVPAAQLPPSLARDPFSADRFRVSLRSDNFLPHEWRVRADIDVVSDNRYVADFDELSVFRRDRFLESRLWAFRHFGSDGRGGLVGSILYADDLQNPDDVDRDQFLLQRLPAISLDWLPAPVLHRTGLVASLDVDYVYFRPRRSPEAALRADPGLVVGKNLFLDTGIDGVPDALEGNEFARRINAERDPLLDIHGDNLGPEGDGLFQEGEPLADRGHRWIFHPRVARPIRLADSVELYPELGYQQTIYASSAQQFAERGVFSARTDLRVRLQRNFGSDGRFSHLLEPRLSWLLTRRRSQRGNPLFVPGTAVPQRRVRQLSLDNVTLDPSDRIENVHTLVLGLENRVYAQGGRRRLLADFLISGDWDFERGRLGQLVLDGGVSGIGRASTRFNLAVDPKRGRIEEGLLDASWSLPTGGGVGLRYRFLRQIPLFFESFRGQDRDRFAEFDENFDRVHQIDFSTRIELSQRWALGYNLSYAIDSKLVLSNRGTLAYTSKCRCWAIQLEVREDRVRGTQYTLRYAILGLGDDRGNPFAGAFGLGSGTALP